MTGTSSPAARLGVADQRFRNRIGASAAQALAADLARHPGPKHGLLLGVGDGSVVLAAAVDALQPEDTLTVVAGADQEEIQTHVELSGSVGRAAGERGRQRSPRPTRPTRSWWPSRSPAAPTRSAASSRRSAKHLNPGGVVSVAVPAAPFLAGGAGEELDRQAVLYGVGSDLVLRNAPPVRVHRLRYTPADAAAGRTARPAGAGTSSVRADPRHAHRLQRRRRRGYRLGAAALAPAGPAGVAALAAAGAGRRCRWPPSSATPSATCRTTRRPSWRPATARCSASSTCATTASATEEFLRIAVFLSVLDVHVNRSPVAGRVVDHFVVDGGFAAAMKPEAEHNVAAYTVLETDPRHRGGGPADRPDRPPDRAPLAGGVPAGARANGSA